MLSSEKLIAFGSTTNADRARAFYRDTFGLRLVSEDGFALRFHCGGTTLRVTIAPEVIPAKYTVLGWSVEDLKATLLSLQKRGVQFERFGFFKQDRSDVLTKAGKLGEARIFVATSWFSIPWPPVLPSSPPPSHLPVQHWRAASRPCGGADNGRHRLHHPRPTHGGAARQDRPTGCAIFV
jgi:catechol 2,3-dioxygenase-like lactoylglutathione lyase family enzyme